LLYKSDFKNEYKTLYLNESMGLKRSEEVVPVAHTCNPGGDQEDCSLKLAKIKNGAVRREVEQPHLRNTQHKKSVLKC
jgi:hypothetical protein